MKVGQVAVIGKANAGKSTLVNVLVGEKVSIVSMKPQTTRDRILGIKTTDDYQIVFEDTPGLFKYNNRLNAFMQRNVTLALDGVDLCMYVVDGHKGIKEDEIKVIENYAKKCEKLIVVVSKIDIMEKERVPHELAKLSSIENVLDIIPVSARKGKNVNELLKVILSHLQEGEMLFPNNVISDKSEKFMVAEIMREKLLLMYEREIPYGVAIVINSFGLREGGDIYDVDLDIVCERQKHKGLIIGHQGQALKKTVAFAREDMEKFLGKKVFLKVYVKVKEEWRNDPSKLIEFGYSINDFN